MIMMFSELTIAVEIIALVVATGLLGKCGADMCCRGFAKGVAYFGIVVSIIAMLCTGYHGYQAHRNGGECPCHMMERNHMMDNNHMMDHGNK